MVAETVKFGGKIDILVNNAGVFPRTPVIDTGDLQLKRSWFQRLVGAINDLGQQSWELVQAICYKDPKAIVTWGAFLKRPSISQTVQPAQQAAATPHQAAAAPANDKASPHEGFDLSGNEFQLKTP